MIEPSSTAATCRACGALLGESWVAPGGFCPQCGAAQLVYPPPLAQYPVEPVSQQPLPLDPDHPRWGIWSGIGVWVFSIASLIVAQIVVVAVFYALDKSRGLPVPPLEDAKAMTEWLLTPRILAASVYSTIVAHLLTVLFCWAVVTRLRSQPFLASLGWHWAGHSALYWLGLAVLLFIGINFANVLFERYLPQKETDFDQLLKAGPQVRIAIAILASFSAPLVEEIVYRGVIFSGLRKRFSAATTIIVVTLLFAGVHVPQYFGAWASIAGLMLLSLVLTVVRAKSKSLLPCIVIHFINNAVVSLVIIFKQSEP